MASETRNTAEERAIRTLMDDAAKAIRAKDVEGSLANYAPDVLSFDVVNPLQYTGSDAVRTRLQEWFSSFKDDIGFEMRDLRITAGDDVAFCSSLNHVSATTTDGAPLDMWWRATMCWRKIDGAWMVTHNHASVPMDAASGKASVNLKP